MALAPPAYRPRDAEHTVLHAVIREHLEPFLRAVSDRGEGNHRLQSGDIDRAHHIDLVFAAANGQALKPLLPGHQGQDRHRRRRRCRPLPPPLLPSSVSGSSPKCRRRASSDISSVTSSLVSPPIER
jgi:hypothetical protein